MIDADILFLIDSADKKAISAEYRSQSHKLLVESNALRRTAKEKTLRVAEISQIEKN